MIAGVLLLAAAAAYGDLWTGQTATRDALGPVAADGSLDADRLARFADRFAPAQRQARPDTIEQSTFALDYSIIGVVESETRQLFLLSGPQGVIRIAPGDAVDGYTLSHVEGERAVFLRGDEDIRLRLPAE